MRQFYNKHLKWTITFQSRNGHIVFLSLLFGDILVEFNPRGRIHELIFVVIIVLFIHWLFVVFLTNACTQVLLNIWSVFRLKNYYKFSVYLLTQLSFHAIMARRHKMAPNPIDLIPCQQLETSYVYDSSSFGLWSFCTRKSGVSHC